MKLQAAVIAAALLAAPGWASAQEATSPAGNETAVAPVAEMAVAPVPAVRLPAGTVVEVELTDALGSDDSNEGDLFGLRLLSPLFVDGHEIAPIGAIGGGEVIDATPSGFGGRQGRLIVSGRFIEVRGQRVRIRGMQITAVGDDRTNTALAVSMIPYAGVASLFIQGGEIQIPVGARGTARIAEDVQIPLTEAELNSANAQTETISAPAEQTAATPPTTSGENQQ
ncbi:hypothetical protein [Terricaulis sp.]|uniref:hypothetical protein n=1 Tax=Terricaulis sp. TaxID=2768686 RepID=UPI0037836BE4